VLRILEEEAMKKGTEKVIAHLPIECATFLLNEKRSAIEQIEARLKVGIIILPSKHLETPAYDIERIKEKEPAEEKPSYLQIKAEDITIPEFAQQVKHSTEKPAIKEFLHDSPAPVQNKNESASLVKRFWHKLIGPPGAEPKVKEKVVQVAEKTKPSGEGQLNRNRGNRQGQNLGRNRGRGQGQGQSQTAEQAQRPEQEQAEGIERPNRNPQGQQGRNVRRNLAPANLPAAKTEQVKAESVAVSEMTSSTLEVSAPAGNQPKRNSARRGPNRRRPRNPNYKKPEDGESNTAEASNENRGEPRPAQIRTYDNDFAERVERTERPEPQPNVLSQVNISNQDSEARRPAVEPAPKPVERVKQDTESES
jgi:ribonuclease E